MMDILGAEPLIPDVRQSELSPARGSDPYEGGPVHWCEASRRSLKCPSRVPVGVRTT